jgi:hypothetical protein
MYQGALLLDFHSNDVKAELQLPAERLEAALGAHVSPRLSKDGSAQVANYILRNVTASLPDGRAFEVNLIDSPYVERIEGAPYVVASLRLIPPAGTSANLFELYCGVLLDRIPAQVVLAAIRTDWRTSTFANDPKLLAVLHGSERTIHVDRRRGS